MKAADPAAGVTCGAGYVAVKRADGRVVCTLVDSSKGDPTRYNSYNPAKETQPGLRPNKQAGAGPMSGADTNDYDHDYAGQVGGFTPVPAAITSTMTLSVRDGETPRQLAARAFGDEAYLGKLIRMNPGIESDGLTVGDVVRIN